MIWWWLSISYGWSEPLTVATLNLGHGRGTGVHQTFQSQQAIQQNVDKVSEIISPFSVDVLALQEVDTRAWWSGGWNQTQRLGEGLQLPYVLEGAHSQKAGLIYGAGLLSRFEFAQSNTVSERSTFPLPPKGFVMATMMVEQQSIVVVSLHLDPIRAAIRQQQVLSLQRALESIEAPIIIMGDFNVEWGTELEQFCTILNVSAHQPLEAWVTFPKLQRRLDWILFSDEIEVLAYETVEQKLSDHRLVVATVEVRGDVLD